MARAIVILAAVIAVCQVANGRPDLPDEPGMEEQVNIVSTSHCINMIQVFNPSEEGTVPYPVCSSQCTGAEQEFWVDGVIIKRLAELEPYGLMVEMTFTNGSLQDCKMVPYETAEESTARAAKRPRIAPEEPSQDETIVLSVTEPVPTIHRGLEGFTRVGDFYYMVTPEVMTWHDAVQHCKEYGATLASIESQQEQTLLQGVLSTDVWLGISDSRNEGSFENLDNTPIKYSNWNKNEPNDDGKDEDCGMLVSRVQLKWNDMICQLRMRALCKHPLVSDRKKYKCPNGFWQHQSSCYFLSSTAHIYSEGEDFCSRRGAYPAFINSQSEHNFLKGKSSGNVYIGYTDSCGCGKFTSKRFGEPLFTRWAPNEPNNALEDEFCVHMESYRNFDWNDIPCQTKLKIWCEMEAEIED